jgi:hypothetical protein
MASVVQTKIYSEERKEFQAYMIAVGFTDFKLVKPRKDLYLRVEFETPESVFNYKLRGVEEAYKASRGNRYYSDLDQDWDDEAEEFFEDDEERDL